MWLVAAVTGGGVVGALAMTVLRSPGAVLVTPEGYDAGQQPGVDAAPPENIASAQDLRARAFAAIDAHEYDEALYDLTEARMLDPAGDEDPRVQAAYKRVLSDVPDASKPHGKLK